MKITSVITTLRGVRCVKFKAVIPKSTKNNIPKRHQKTWSLETCAPEFTSQEMKPAIYQEAKRWEERILRKYKEQKEAEVGKEKEIALANKIPLWGADGD